MANRGAKERVARRVIRGQITGAPADCGEERGLHGEARELLPNWPPASDSSPNSPIFHNSQNICLNSEGMKQVPCLDSFSVPCGLTGTTAVQGRVNPQARLLPNHPGWYPGLGPQGASTVDPGSSSLLLLSGCALCSTPASLCESGVQGPPGIPRENPGH